MAILADQALERLLQYDFKTVIDIGSGPGAHAKILESHGKEVVTVNLQPPATFVRDYNSIGFQKNVWDAVWASHVLEHQTNTNFFLEKIKDELKPGGVLAITVPPLKHNIVGGHINLYNAGILVYQLILAGFDCSGARVGAYGYNISVIVKNRDAKLPELNYDRGDIEKLAPFFPVPMAQNTWGEFTCRWED